MCYDSKRVAKGHRFYRTAIIALFISGLSLNSLAAASAIDDVVQLLSVSISCPAPAYDLMRRNTHISRLERHSYTGNTELFRLTTKRQSAVLVDYDNPPTGVIEYEELVEAQYRNLSLVAVDVKWNTGIQEKREVSLSCKDDKPCFKIQAGRAASTNTNQFSIFVCSEEAAADIKTALEMLIRNSSKN